MVILFIDTMKHIYKAVGHASTKVKGELRAQERLRTRIGLVEAYLLPGLWTTKCVNPYPEVAS